jgi:pyridoxal 5'-phosphate synthase pdxT subunit
MVVGILALQGNFSRHTEVLESKGVTVKEIRSAKDLSAVSALVLPGGESSTILSLLSRDLRSALVDAIRSGMPTLATCAGLILIARRVDSPNQGSLGLLNVDVKRNAYGRQLDSFIAELEWADSFERAICREDSKSVEGVFIRAPKIVRVGENVSPILRHKDDVVLVRYRNIVAATFHPELSERSDGVYELFFSLERRKAA